MNQDDKITANLNMKIIWRLALKYSMLRDDNFHLSIIPEEQIAQEVIEHNASSDLLRSLRDVGTFFIVTLFQMITTISIMIISNVKFSKFDIINDQICDIDYYY